MEQLSANFNENVRWFNEVLGVGRSCDLVNRDLVIGGRRARIWVIDGFGGDAILERIGAFWLSISPEAVAGIDRMQAFVDRFVTFLEADVGTDPEEITTNVLLGKTLLLVEGIHSTTIATIGADGHPQTRVIDMMLYDERGVYFLTAKGKAFYAQLMEQGFIALSATKDKKAISLCGKVKNIDLEKLDILFEKNPYMKQIYLSLS